MKNILWTISLSNGETLYENKGDFQIVPGELSPWQRLISYMADKGAEITSMSLYSNDGRRWNLPSAGKNPKFHALMSAEKPISYKFFRKMGMDTTGPNAGIEEHFAVIEATYADGKKIQVWVDDKTGNSWSFIL